MQKLSPSLQSTARMTSTVSNSQTVQRCEEQSQDGHLLLALINKINVAEYYHAAVLTLSSMQTEINAMTLALL